MAAQPGLRNRNFPVRPGGTTTYCLLASAFPSATISPLPSTTRELLTRSGARDRITKRRARSGTLAADNRFLCLFLGRRRVGSLQLQSAGEISQPGYVVFHAPLL